MTTIVEYLKLDRTTKGAYRFQPIDLETGRLLKYQESKVGTVYVRQTAFNVSQPPENIRVTIEVLD